MTIPQNGVRAVDKPIGTLLSYLYGAESIDGVLRDRRFDRATVIATLQFGLGPIKDTKANLLADLAWAANTIGWVVGDGANNGIYAKSGGTGTGTWTKKGDLPVADLSDLYDALRSQELHSIFPTAGTSTAYTGTTTNTLTALVSNVTKVFARIHATCGDDPTFNLNGLGALSILTETGGSVKAGDIRATCFYPMVYVSSGGGSWRIQLNRDRMLRRDAPMQIVVGGTSTAYTGASIDGAIGTLRDGQAFAFQSFNVTCGADPTMNIDSVGAVALKTETGGALVAGAIRAGQTLEGWYVLSNTTIRCRLAARLALRRDTIVRIATTGGTNTAYTSTASIETLGSYATDQRLSLIFNAECGDDPTLAIDGLSALPLKTETGGAIKAGHIQPNYEYIARISGGTSIRLSRVRPDALTTRDLSLDAGETTGTSAAYVASIINGPLAAWREGQKIWVKLHTTCAAAPTFNLDSLGTLTIKADDGTALLAGDLAPAFYMLRYSTSGGAHLRAQTGRAVRASLRRDTAVQIATTAGTSTAYTGASLDGNFTGVDGQRIIVRNFHTVCGDNPTLNIDGLGAAALKDEGGNAILAGRLRVGVEYEGWYVSSGNTIRLRVAATLRRDAAVQVAVTTGTSTAYVGATADGTLGTLQDSQALTLKGFNAVSGDDPTLAIDGLTAAALKTETGGAIKAGQLRTGTAYEGWYVASGNTIRLRVAEIARVRRDAAINILSTAGSSTAYTATSFDGTLGTLIDDQAVLIHSLHAICGDDPTLSIDGITAAALKTESGGAIKAGQLRTGTTYLGWYASGSNTIRLKVAEVARVRRDAAVNLASTAGTATAYTAASFDGSLGTLIDGQAIYIHALHATCGDDPTLAIDGLAAADLKAEGGGAIKAGQLVAGRGYHGFYASGQIRLDINGYLAVRRDTPLLLATTAGTSTAYTSTALNGETLKRYTDGQRLSCQLNVECGNDPTLAIDGLSALPLKTDIGSAIKAGYLHPARQYEMRIDGGGTEIRVLRIFSDPITRRDAPLEVGTTAGTGLAYTSTPLNFPDPSLRTGLKVWARLHVACLANPTLKVGGLAAIPITSDGGEAIAAGDLQASFYIFRYTTSAGGQWQVMARDLAALRVIASFAAVARPIPNGRSQNTGAPYAITSSNRAGEAMMLGHRKRGGTMTDFGLRSAWKWKAFERGNPGSRYIALWAPGLPYEIVISTPEDGEDNTNPTMDGLDLYWNARTGSSSRTVKVSLHGAFRGLSSGVRYIIIVPFIGQSTSFIGNLNNELLHPTALAPTLSFVPRFGPRGHNDEQLPTRRKEQVRTINLVDFYPAFEKLNQLSGTTGLNAGGKYATDADPVRPGLHRIDRSSAGDTAIAQAAWGIGGIGSNEVADGTFPDANLKEFVRRAQIVSLISPTGDGAQRVPLVPCFVHVGHESDQPTTADAVVTNMLANQATQRTFFRKRFGTVEVPDSYEYPMLTDALGSWAKNPPYGAASGITGPDLPLGLLKACLLNPTRIKLILGRWFLPHLADGVHLTARSEEWRIAYYERIIERILKNLIAGSELWDTMPTYITSAEVNGTALKITFHQWADSAGGMAFTPGGLITPITAKGLTWRDAGDGNTVTVVDGSLDWDGSMGDNVLVGAVSLRPTGSSPLIGIADQFINGTGPISGPRCEIMSPSTDVSINGDPLHNFPVTQRAPVTVS